MVSTTLFGAYLLIKMRILILIYSETKVSHQLWGKWAIYVVLCLILNSLEEHCTVSALTCNKIHLDSLSLYMFPRTCLNEVISFDPVICILSWHILIRVKESGECIVGRRNILVTRTLVMGWEGELQICFPEQKVCS